jgi:transposase
MKKENLTNQIYLMMGKLLEKIQYWEAEFKKFTIKNNIEKSDDKRSLSNMNNFLHRNKHISDEQYNQIKEIIELRNIIIHQFFIKKHDFDILDFLFLAEKKIDISLYIFNK